MQASPIQNKTTQYNTNQNKAIRTQTKPIQDKTMQDNTRQDKPKTRQDNTKTRQHNDTTMQYNTRQHKRRRDNVRQYMTR